MNVLVGATGFIGGHVVEYLFQQNEISRGTFRKGSHLKVMDLNGVQAVEADLLDHHSLHEAFEGADTVYSMASPMPFGDVDYRLNTEGVLNMLEVAEEMKVKCIVHLSTLDVYGFSAKKVDKATQPAPSGEYQKSKLEADRILLEFGSRSPETRVVIVRPSRALGSRDYSLTAPLLGMIAEGKVVLPAGPVKSFTHAKDVAQAMYLAATNTRVANKVYSIKSFDASIRDVAGALTEALGESPAIVNEGVFSKSRLPKYTAAQLKAGVVLTEGEGWDELGYAPQYDIAKSCAEIANWFKREPWAADAQ
jgi:nucleoside-diphosphate-sugar epimerase